MHHLWHDEKTRKEHKGIVIERSTLKEKAREVQAVVCVEEACRRDPNKEEKARERSNGLVVKALDSQSRIPVFKTTGWLQGRLSLSSFRGR